MPWNEVSIMERRQEFLSFANQVDANIASLCRSFGISRKTGYKWLGRLSSGHGEADVCDRSRRPHSSPRRTSEDITERIVSRRHTHPAWGARKIAHVLAAEGIDVPSVSTVHAILVRHGCITATGHEGRSFGSFEKEAPNLMWQMDFKGQVQLGDGQWCYPLTIIDDHSRFALCVQGCANQRTLTVKDGLEQTFRLYGLPAAFYVDNGPPWGGGTRGQFTPLTVWLLKLGVDVIHATPYSPQGRGKNERFHRSLKAEVLTHQPLADMRQAQRCFDDWRSLYNHKRPHQSLDMQVPASRYRPSSRPMPSRLPTVEYDSSDIVRKVPTDLGAISFRNRQWRVPKAFRGEHVALRPTGTNTYDICFGAKRIATIDLTST